MADSDNQEIKLLVANTGLQHGGHDRLASRSTLPSVGVREGQIVEIIGKRHTAAIALSAYLAGSIFRDLREGT